MANNDEIEPFHGEVSRWFSGAFDAITDIMRPLSRVEVSHDKVIITFDVPGVSKEGISVTCTKDSVSIEAETRKQFWSGTPGRTVSGREFSKYSERVHLPVLVDPDQGTAKYRNGMLVVTLPRSRPGKGVKIVTKNAKDELS